MIRKPPPSRPSGQRLRHPPRVLLVDDDDELCSLLSQALREAGLQVLIGTDGCQLVDYVLLSQQHSSVVPTLDLVVTDVRMPNATGLQALERLRGLDGIPPILLMTAFGSHAVHDAACRLGAVGVIDKPFDLEDFCTIVANLVGTAN